MIVLHSTKHSIVVLVLGAKMGGQQSACGFGNQQGGFIDRHIQYNAYDTAATQQSVHGTGEVTPMTASL